jgi:hypothetical protein
MDTARMERIRADRKAERAEREATAARYAARFPGWRDSSAPACPRVVAGKRCRRYRHHLGRGGPCLCETYSYRPLDHARQWLKPDGSHALTAEPYHLDNETMIAFIRDCAALGLKVSVSDDSPYYPGSSWLVLVDRDA